MKIEFPPDLTPVNIKVYLYCGFNICGCSEIDKVIEALKNILSQINDKNKNWDWYEKIYNNSGVYYLIVAKLDELRLIEHGSSIRHCWLTEDGKKFLDGLNKYTTEEIDLATGEAYDGAFY